MLHYWHLPIDMAMINCQKACLQKRPNIFPNDLPWGSGTPDICLIYKQRVCGIELKSNRGKPEISQLEVFDEYWSKGHTYYFCFDIKTVKEYVFRFIKSVDDNDPFWKPIKQYDLVERQSKKNPLLKKKSVKSVKECIVCHKPFVVRTPTHKVCDISLCKDMWKQNMKNKWGRENKKRKSEVEKKRMAMKPYIECPLNLSIYKYIYWDGKRVKFRVVCRLDGIKRHFGYYDTLEDSLLARKKYIPRELWEGKDVAA